MDDPEHGGDLPPRRTTKRCSITAEANLRRPGKTTYRVRICDLSPGGCKLEFVDRPLLDEVVWLKFDGFDAFEASICWVEGTLTGLQFQREIYTPIFEHLVRKLGGSA